MIAKAANDPSVDIEKMERLLEMQERIFEQQAKSAYSESLAACQLELPIIPKRGAVKNKQGSIQSTYAKWEDINELIKPVLAKHGFSLSFRCEPNEGKAGVIVHGILTHSGGHVRECAVPVPADVSGNKNNVQAIGSAMSYGKRYATGFLLNLTEKDEDDDGAAAGLGNSVSIEDAKGVWQRWKAKHEKGTVKQFEKWVEETCGVLQPNNPSAWRVEDLDKCHAELDR